MAAAGIKEKQRKTGDGSSASGERVLEQKQPGLYTVIWHPIGGQPRPETLAALGERMQTIDGTELRLAPDETAYIINLTGAEAEKILEATRETAQTKFETSVSCIGASICQVWCTRFAGSVTGVCKGGRGGTDPGRRTSADSYFRMSVFLRYPPDWTDNFRRADGRFRAHSRHLYFIWAEMRYREKRRWDVSLARCLRARFKSRSQTWKRDCGKGT